MPRYKASQYPITIVQGEDFTWNWIGYLDAGQTPRDWTGYTGEAQVRKKASSSTPLLTFSVALGSDGSIRIAADREATDGLPAPSRAVWDIFVTPLEGERKRYMAGPVTIEPRVTK